MIRQPYTTVSGAFELPRIVQLDDNIYAAFFFLMKLLPANFILDRAQDHGLIGRGSTVIETTSGTFGLALAILSAEAGYKLIVVSDPAIDAPFKRRLEDLGTRVEIVNEPAAVGGFLRHQRRIGPRLYRQLLPSAQSQRGLAEYPGHPNVLFAGTERAVFVTHDGGGRWTKLTANLPTTRYDDLLVHPRTKDLVLGTHGRGVWILDDASPIGEWTQAIAAKRAHLFDQIVENALRRYNNNRERVARELGVARSTLFKRLKEWGMTKGEDE